MKTVVQNIRFLTAAAGLVVLGAMSIIGLTSLSQQPIHLDPKDPTVTLDDVEAYVARRYRTAEITSAELAQLLDRPDTIVMDIRDRAEFEQSHLPGAIHVLPDMSASDFMARYGDTISGKTVIFYCSVGVRSSVMLNRIAEFDNARAQAMFNKRGGIFRWHLEGRSLVAAGGKTETVHPFNGAWEDLLERSRSDRS